MCCLVLLNLYQKRVSIRVLLTIFMFRTHSICSIIYWLIDFGTYKGSSTIALCVVSWTSRSCWTVDKQWCWCECTGKLCMCAWRFAIRVRPFVNITWWRKQLTLDLCNNILLMNTTKTGWTALHFVSYVGRKNIVELLIKSGANVNIVSDEVRLYNYWIKYLWILHDDSLTIIYKAWDCTAHCCRRRTSGNFQGVVSEWSRYIHQE